MCVIALENRRARIPGIDDKLCDGTRADVVRHVHGREGQVAVEYEHGMSAGRFVLDEFRLQRLAFRRVGVFTFGDDDAARLVDTDLRTASNSSCGVAATPMVTEMPRSAAALTTPCDTDAK